MNKAILLATLAIVAVAGCTTPSNFQIPFVTSPTTFVGGNGLVITDFVSDKTELYNNQSAKLTMTISNKGGAVVAANEALAVLQGSAVKETLTDGLYWKGRSTTNSVYIPLTTSMSPYDPVRDVPADEKTLNWYLTSPTGISAGTTRTDVFIGRLYYDYSTSVTGNVWVYSETESQSAKSEGRTLNQNSFTSTSGPVGVIVTIKPSNVVVSDADNEFTMQIKVTNSGGGTVYRQGAVSYDGSDLTIDPDADLNRLSVTVDNVPEWNGEEACTDSEVELTKGEATIYCDVTVNSIPSTFRSDQIKVTANYGYWTEKTVSVTVSGR